MPTVRNDSVTDAQPTLSFVSELGVPFTVRRVEYGQTCGPWDKRVHDKEEAVIEFFDSRFTSEHPLGQFVSSYYESTLLAREHRQDHIGLDLNAGVDSWKVDPQNMAAILEWMKETAQKESLAAIYRPKP